MNNNKKGFTLIELLAVIVLLAIILITATITVNSTIKKSRTKAFDNTMLSIVETAKNILSKNNDIRVTDFKNTIKSNLKITDNEYKIDTAEITDSEGKVTGYRIVLEPGDGNKFKNINLSSLGNEKNTKFIYQGSNKVCAFMNKNGNVVTEDSNGTVITSCVHSPTLASNTETKPGMGTGDIPEITTPIINDKVPNIKVEMADRSSLCTKFTKKGTYIVGDVIALCNKKTGKSEDFNVINDNGTKVTMLAMYNLNIETDGLQDIPYNTNSNDEKEKHVYPLAFTAKDTGHHNRFCSGCYYGYWVNSKGKLLDSNGNLVNNPKYPYYVYNSNSLLQPHIANYVSYIKNELKISDISCRLINHTELKNLGCSRGDRTCRNSSYKWLYNSSYWTGSAYDEYEVWGVYYSGKYESNYFYYSGYYQFDNGFGVRPVITIDKSEL